MPFMNEKPRKARKTRKKYAAILYVVKREQTAQPRTEPISALVFCDLVNYLKRFARL